MARAPAALALAVGLALAGARPAAAEDTLPRGQFGLAGVFRKNHGAMAERYGLGYLWGFVAGYRITRGDDALSFGLTLATLFGRSQFWGTLGDDDPTVAGGALQYLEGSLGVRGRYQPGEDLPLLLAVGGGVALLRTNVPIPPDDERHHLGGYAAGGLDYYAFGGVLFALEARFGLLGEGPSSTSLMFSVALGR